MKNRINKLIACVCMIMIAALSSCDKYLEQRPDMRTEINTIDKVAQLVGTAYPGYNYLAMAETFSDNVADKGVGEGHVDEPYSLYYFWEDVEGFGNNSPTQYWNGVYSGIAAANHALEAIEENDFGDAVLPYKGEALVARAYGHFMLALFFAQPYNPQEGADNSSPGIPYADKPETVALASFSRGTVQETYDRIRQDLEEGIALLRGGYWEVPKYHFNTSSANAFAARFYLFTGEYDKAIAAANNVFPGGDYSGKTRQVTTTIQSYSLAEQLIELTKADKEYNLLLTETYSVFQRTSSSIYSRYGFGQRIYQDFYNRPVFTGTTIYNRGVSYQSGLHYTSHMFNEYFFYTNVQAGIGQPYIMQPLLTSDEALLNRAEAYIQTNNYAAALLDINYFLSHRVSNYSQANHALTVQKAVSSFGGDEKSALLTALLRIRQRAFVTEGIRWMDIVRHRLPVEHILLDEVGSESTIRLEPDDLRRVFQIPADAVSTGIEANPR